MILNCIKTQTRVHVADFHVDRHSRQCPQIHHVLYTIHDNITTRRFTIMLELDECNPSLGFTISHSTKTNMSGVSLAVAARPDVEQKTPPRRRQDDQTPMEDVMESLRMIDLQLIAFITVFSASGLVPLFDLLFPAFTSAYVLLLSQLVFPELDCATTSKERLFQSSKPFRVYVIVGLAVGLFLPVAYVLGGFVRGDEHAIKSATPHLFLLSFQILTEKIVSGLGLFSPPVRALVPMLYTVRRIFVLLDWVRDVWVNKTLPSNAETKDVGWFWFGRILAVANLAYYSITLFGFLIPRFLPRAFEQYFKERNEIEVKSMEDVRSNTQKDVGGKSEEATTGEI